MRGHNWIERPRPKTNEKLRSEHTTRIIGLSYILARAETAILTGKESAATLELKTLRAHVDDLLSCIDHTQQA